MKDGCTSERAGKRRSIELPILPNSAEPQGPIAHSRTSRWRAGALIALNVLMIAHIIQWKVTGTTVSPIEPSETMFTLQNGAINAGFIFFTLAIVATLVFGRFVCGWGCHIVALQDFCAWLLQKIGLKPRPFRSRLLVYVPLLAAIYMFVWPTVYRYVVKPPSEPLIPQFTNHIITTEFWATFPTVAVAIPFLFICGFMTVYFLGQKGFCTYACPYGGFFGLADKVAPGKIRVTDACNQCGHCTATCTSNVIVHAEVKQYGMVVDPGCMKCMDCISVCPNDALYFGFGKPSIMAVSSKNVPRNYTLTWPEEIAGALIFGLSLFAVWDVYQLVPMLMALGVAGVTTYLALRTWRLISSSDVSFYKWNLKGGGKIKTAGWVFLAFSLAWIGLNAHSGYIRWNERAGAIAFENVRIPDELALAEANADQWLNAPEKKNISDGRESFHAARGAGLFVNKQALSKVAWLEYLGGDTEQALALLAEAAGEQHGQPRALSLYYRGAILNRLGRADEALVDLDTALNETPNLVTAREEKGEALWRLGRRDEAVAAWTDAVRSNPNLPVGNSFLAGSGLPAATSYEVQADRVTPNDAYFHWMLGLRLQNIGMTTLAEKHFQRAIQTNPRFRSMKR
ncbi:MAG TPA: 4Fe-4S binding protein [Pyrinomonadaceae bacterium]|nr:4Fe-4S binding protein [Pyrinomonadaceae bacterium]